MQVTARAPAGQAGKVALKPASAAKALGHVAKPVRYSRTSLHPMFRSGRVLWPYLLWLDIGRNASLPAKQA